MNNTENQITIKELADKLGVSYELIRRKLNTIKETELYKDHIINSTDPETNSSQIYIDKELQEYLKNQINN